jgi:hypothetical protein
MRTAIFGLAILFGAVTVAAAAPEPAAARPEAAKPEPAKPATCKRTVVGKGLDRHVTCEIDVPIVVPQSAPKPNVVIVHNDGRTVTGRPRAGDRFIGLSHQLR